MNNEKVDTSPANVTDEIFGELIKEGQLAVKEFKERRCFHEQPSRTQEMMFQQKFITTSSEQKAKHAAAQATAAITEAITTLENRLLLLTLSHEKLRKKVKHLERHLGSID